MQNYFTNNIRILDDASRILEHTNAPYANLCHLALETILSRINEYDAIDCLPHEILEHTIEVIHLLPEPIAIFSLFEDLSLINRAYSLLADEPSPNALKILQAFENMGEWTPGDGTIVSDWYWLRLPAIVLSQCKEQRRRLAHTFQNKST